MSMFDIIGPIMIGPSSSHTAGAARIGLMARHIFQEEPKKADITVYGSFAKTYRGHGTDRALVAGILGIGADDVRLRTSFEIAKERHVEINLHPSDAEVRHPNTVRIRLTGEDNRVLEVLGVSLSGRNERADMIIATDGRVPNESVEEIKKIDGVNNVITILPL